MKQKDVTKRNWKFEDEELPDPYSLAEVQLLDDLKQWPNIEFGDIYTYQFYRFIRQGITESLQVARSI